MALLLGGCGGDGGDDDGAGGGGDGAGDGADGDGAGPGGDGGGDGSAGGERDATGQCRSAEGTGTCTQAELDTYTDCAITRCSAEYEACLGANYLQGEFGGACQSYMECTSACDCDDTACTQGCTQPAECTSCFTNIGQCVLNNCQLPACATGGAGDGVSDGVGDGVDTGSKTCADLEACCASIADANQKSQCEQTYNGVKAGGDLACNGAYSIFSGGGLCQ